jgi:hypothetical protein
MATSQYSAGRFAIEIGGTPVGFASSVSGGEAFADVIPTAAPSGVVEKRPGPVRYAPIVLEVDASLASDFYDWISGFLDGTQKSKSGVIRLLDYALREQSRLEWTDALITEVAFPAADASARDAATLRVTLQPDGSRRVDGSGTTLPSAAQSHQKRWLPANFKFSITGLETATRKANRVAELVLTRPVTGTPGALVAGTLEVPDVAFSVPNSEARDFYDWFDDFVVKGRNTAGDERTGSLVFLDPALKELIGVSLKGLGIVRVSQERLAQGSAAIARVKVTMYCEQVRLSPVPTQAAPPAPAPVPPPTGAQPTDTGMSSSIAVALLDALRIVAATSANGSVVAPMSPSGAVRGDIVAERLLSTIAPSLDTTPQSPAADLRGDRGRDLGTKWASTTATLDELAEASELDGAEWSALVLPEGHSLITFLVGQGELREGETGRIDLDRDDFTEGIVAGAADVQRQAAPHLEGRLSRREALGRG